MARLSSTATPSYRKHNASGQACVVLNGRTLYLGRYGIGRPGGATPQRSDFTALPSPVIHICPRRWRLATTTTPPAVQLWSPNKGKIPTTLTTRNEVSCATKR